MTIDVPDEWQVEGRALMATEFQQQALACTSIEAVDAPTDANTGQPALAHSVVQLCTAPLDDDLDLGSWLAGRGQTTWTVAMYGTCQVYELPGDTQRQLAYLQTATIRAEIAATVTTTPDRTETRRAEVEFILASVRCTTPGD